MMFKSCNNQYFHSSTLHCQLQDWNSGQIELCWSLGHTQRKRKIKPAMAWRAQNVSYYYYYIFFFFTTTCSGRGNANESLLLIWEVDQRHPSWPWKEQEYSSICGTKDLKCQRTSDMEWCKIYHGYFQKEQNSCFFNLVFQNFENESWDMYFFPNFEF